MEKRDVQIFLYLILTILSGCQQGDDLHPQFGQISEYEAIVSTDSTTQRMIEAVRRAYDKVDPEKVPYILNHEKVKILKKRLDDMEIGAERNLALYDYGQELLRSGETEEAIDVFGNFLSFFTDREFVNKVTTLNEFRQQLAICHLRKGEQDNCIQNHTNESCIIPISEIGQHIQRESSNAAIFYLNQCLETHPTNYEYQYLLNIAHMTLGTYPDSVPPEFIIPLHYFQQDGFPKFEDIGSNLGVDVNELSGGLCVGDFNGDFYLDLMVSSWGFEDQIRYYENDRSGGFLDRTSYTGLVGVTGGLNLKHADYNNDGHLDFVILRGAWLENYGGIPNSLIRNNGDGTFTDVTQEVGMYSLRPTQTAVWADFNLDGWLDLFIANESKPNSVNPCELFLNTGKGTFREVAQEANLRAFGFFKGVDAGDINNDGFPDLYISNFEGNNLLYVNRGLDNGLLFAPFEDSMSIAGPYESFPTWMFDYNNDGFEDIFVSGYSNAEKSPANMLMANIRNPHDPRIMERRPKLYRNNGDGSFDDVGYDLGLTEPAPTMGCNFGDLDNDGFLDFYLATGDPSFLSIVPNRMYRNIGGERFEDITFSGGFGHIQKGHAIGFGDLDLDGDQDIYAVMGGAYEGDNYQNVLFENPIGNKNNWINIILEGTVSNRSAIGSRVKISINDQDTPRTVFHTVGSGASFGGNSLMAEIGLGQARVIKSLEITWANAKRIVSVYTDIPVNKVIRIKEGQEEVDHLDLSSVDFTKGHDHHSH